MTPNPTPATPREISIYAAAVSAISSTATLMWAAEFLASDNPDAPQQLAMLRAALAAAKQRPALATTAEATLLRHLDREAAKPDGFAYAAEAAAMIRSFLGGVFL